MSDAFHMRSILPEHFQFSPTLYKHFILLQLNWFILYSFLRFSFFIYFNFFSILNTHIYIFSSYTGPPFTWMLFYAFQLRSTWVPMTTSGLDFRFSWPYIALWTWFPFGTTSRMPTLLYPVQVFNYSFFPMGPISPRSGPPLIYIMNILFLQSLGFTGSI